MEKKGVLEELSYSLPEKERVNLLERINRSLEEDLPGEESSSPAEKEQTKNSYINEQLSRIGWFRKFLMMLRCKFSGKKMGEIVIEQQLKNLKKAITRRQAGITGFESRNLTPEFGAKVFSLYSHTFEFREMYRKLWLEPGVYESCCIFIMRSMYEKAKNNLEEFISIDELVDIYSETGRKDDLIKEIDSRINEYCSSIPSILYDEIEKSIAPVYKMKDLILFPYTAFFQKFSFTPSRSEGGKHFFKNASAMLCLEHLKELYRSVMSASELDENVPLNKFLVEFIKTLDEEKSLPENDREELKKLIIHVKTFVREMPLLEIIQYFRREPYLRIAPAAKRRHFKELYKSIIHRRQKEELLKIYRDVQQKYIEREIERIFEGKIFEEFHNYRKYASVDHQKMGLPFFTHTKSLNVIHNYIKCFYQGYLSDVVSILEKGILAQNRISRDRLLSHAVALQELEDKISASDKSLSPAEDDGKLFHKLRMSLVSEPSQQRMYRSMVINKNREVKSLIDWGDEALGGIEKIFDEIIVSESNVVKVQLNKHYLVRGKSITLVSMMKKRSAHLRDIRRLIAQIVKMESN